MATAPDMEDPALTPEQRASLLKEFSDLAAYAKQAQADLAKVKDDSLFLADAKNKASILQTMANNASSKAWCFAEDLCEQECDDEPCDQPVNVTVYK